MIICPMLLQSEDVCMLMCAPNDGEAKVTFSECATDVVESVLTVIYAGFP
jgi:hypothetical protein